jgi:hypothetical protein
MEGSGVLAVIVTTVAALLFSSAWYAVFGKVRMKLLAKNQSATAGLTKVPASQILFEIVRSFGVVLVVAHLLELAGVHGWLKAVSLGAWLAFFPVMILLGAALWDKRPWKLVAIHGGDWLLKILIVAFMLGLWR